MTWQRLCASAVATVAFAATEAFAGCNPRTQDIADCINVPHGAGVEQRSILSTFDEIMKIKERFESIEAVKLTVEFHEKFDTLNDALETFDDLYGKAIDAETGRNPWKLEEAPGWLSDPLGRLVFEYNAKYEGVAKSIEEFKLPPDMFVFRTSLALYPQFFEDWKSCQLKAVEALTYDLGRIEIMLSELSNQAERLDRKAKELDDLKRVWSTFIIPTYLDPDLRRNPLLPAADLVGLFVDMDPGTMAAAVLAAQNEAKSEIENGSLPKVGQAILNKQHEIDAARQQLLVVHKSLSQGLTGFEGKCASTQPRGSDITGTDKGKERLPDNPISDDGQSTNRISHPKGF